MAARISMAALISQVRTLIGDPAGASAALTDDEIQAIMDTHRQEARYLALEGQRDYEAGSLVYKSWQAPQGQWENNAVLTDTQYLVLTPSAADYAAGRWTFATSQTGVLLTGWSYDLYAAAVDLLEAWAAKAASEYDFSVDGASYHRSQKAVGLRALASEYRKKIQVKTICQVREDVSYVE